MTRNAIQLHWADNSCTTLEPVISHGTFAVGPVLGQNQTLILMLHKGEVKEAPYTGVGIADMLLDHDPLLWRTEIKEQLALDRQSVSSVSITTRGIAIDASY
jgi:hypothetical protein